MKRIIYFFLAILILLGPAASQAQQRKVTTDRARIQAIEKARAERKLRGPSPQAQKPTTTRVTRGAQPRTVRRSTAQSRSATRGAPSSYKLERFQLQANLNAVIIYLEPMDAVIKVGEEFNTGVRLANPKSRGFTRMFLALEYDPDVLLPLEVNDLPLQSAMQTPAKAFVYESSGLMTYEAAFQGEMAVNNQTLLSVKWKALAPTRYSAIKFSSFNERDTMLFNLGENILGEPGILGDGTIGATVRVLHPSPEDESEILTGTTITDYTGPATIGGVKLTLRSMQQKVRVGEEFLVDLDFENTQQTLVDKIHAIIQFDPRVLQVVDYDQENWIARGVNIYDGPYHEEFPFDRHIKNLASNAKGEIEYHMGVSESQFLADRGTVATIVFRAIRPAARASIAFLTPPRLHARGTRVTCMGTNVLGDLNTEEDGLVNLALPIVK